MAPRARTSPDRLSMDTIDFPVKRHAAPAKSLAAAKDAKPARTARRNGAFGVSRCTPSPPPHLSPPPPPRPMEADDAGMCGCRGAQDATPAAEPMEVEQVSEMEESARAPKRAKNEGGAAAHPQQQKQQIDAVPPTALPYVCVFDSIPDKRSTPVRAPSPAPQPATKEAHAAAPLQPGSEAHRKPVPSAVSPPPSSLGNGTGKKRGRPPKAIPAEGGATPVAGKKRARPTKAAAAAAAAVRAAEGAEVVSLLASPAGTPSPASTRAPTPREQADTPPPACFVGVLVPPQPKPHHTPAQS